MEDGGAFSREAQPSVVRALRPGRESPCAGDGTETGVATCARATKIAQ